MEQDLFTLAAQASLTVFLSSLCDNCLQLLYALATSALATRHLIIGPASPARYQELKIPVKGHKCAD